MDSTPTSSDPNAGLERRGLWAFWAATALAAAGAIAPFLLGGGSTRIAGSLIPFGVAALAFGACSLVYHRGRVLATTLYFVASLAIVYGILSALAVPMRIAVLGTCPSESGPCPIGLERPVTSAESTAIGFVIGIGLVAILTAFFGLRTLYHRHRKQVIPPAAPPVRRIAPLATRPQAETTAAPAPVDAQARVEPKSEITPELPAPVAELELPAHEPGPELPAPESQPRSDTTPAPQRTPRRHPERKTSPDSPTPTNGEP
ncbi:MAG: hypothetical protein M3Q90_02535 [Candidatus Dormibacteraeota bacterium]|nr:hypothetical protein [Candidatus Dormibacteraeota bacterium]